MKIIKAFQINDEFDFSKLTDYQSITNYFLFDTQTEKYGGSGRKFNWQVLEKYTFNHPFFLSGGISLRDVQEIKAFSHKSLFAIDVNSRFEDEKGLKKIKELREFDELILCPRP